MTLTDMLLCMCDRACGGSDVMRVRIAVVREGALESEGREGRVYAGDRVTEESVGVGWREGRVEVTDTGVRLASSDGT